MMRYLFGFLWVGLLLCKPQSLLAAPQGLEKANEIPSPLYVDTFFENASPLWYEVDESGTLQLHLLYDHERHSPNRAAGHFHFQILGTDSQTVHFEFNNLQNVWNGTSSFVGRELLSAVVSDDGRHWESIPLELTSENRVVGTVKLVHGSKYVARLEPYRLSDLDTLVERIRKHPQVEISSLGKTVEERNLEMIRIGRDDAKYQVFLRARAHPWEAGGNWVVEGLIDRLLSEDPASKRFLNQIACFILPIANKDGVARGRTRFNSKGKDLNRNWNTPADPLLAPENAALERWLEGRIALGRKPDLAIELHNDGNGRLHISRPPDLDLRQHLARMEYFETLLRRYTWFTEGSTQSSFRNAGSLGEGWLMRFQIDALVHEFNCNHIAGLKERPMAKHWRAYGEQLPLVLEDYFRNRPDIQ